MESTFSASSVLQISPRFIFHLSGGGTGAHHIMRSDLKFGPSERFYESGSAFLYSAIISLYCLKFAQFEHACISPASRSLLRIIIARWGGGGMRESAYTPSGFKFRILSGFNASGSMFLPSHHSNALRALFLHDLSAHKKRPSPVEGHMQVKRLFFSAVLWLYSGG